MFWLLVFFVGSVVLSYLLRPRVKSSASEPGVLQPPDVPAGTPIPVAFGTVKLDPIITEFSYVNKPWYRDGQFLGWRRVVSYLGVLTWGPIAKWVDIVFDETKKLSDQGSQGYITNFDTSHFPPVVSTASTTNGIAFGGIGDPPGIFAGNPYAEIFLPNIFGGLTSGGEGGIQRYFDLVPPVPGFCYGRGDPAPGASYHFLFGTDHNQAPIDDRRVWGGLPRDGSCLPIPYSTSGPGRIRYPRLGYVYLQGVEVGTSPQLKRQQHIITAMYESTVGGDLNPVALLRLVWTNCEWGLGIHPSLIDIGAMELVQNQLHDEGFGISGVLAELKPASDYINEICRTADLAYFRDPGTGLLSVQAIRGGYDISGLPVLDESNIDECTWTRKDIGDTLNEITVTFTDRARNYEKNVVTVQDHANIFMTGAVRSQTIDFPWITQESLAYKIAARELKSNTLPLGHGQLVVTREAFDVVPGDVVKLSWARYGLDEVPVRVRSISAGDLSDGKIVLDVVEDVYGFPDLPYSTTTDPWTNPYTSQSEPPLVSITRNDAGTTAQIALVIMRSASLVTKVEFSTESGISEASDYVEVSAVDGVYVSDSVTLVATYPSRILWRVTYTDPSGEDAFLTGEETFYPANSAQPGTITWQFTASNIAVTVNPDGGASSGIVSCKCVTALDSVPSDSDVRAGTANTTPDVRGGFQFTFSLFPAGSILYITAFLYDADGRESVKLVQPVQNGGVAGTPGTVAAFHMAYTLASGAPTVTAVVNSYVSSVKFAADTVDFPSDATVRAAMADSSAPFTATFGTLTAGVPLYVAAFAYDANGNESPKALLTILVGSTTTGATGGQIVINDGSGGFIDVFDSTADEVVAA